MTAQTACSIKHWGWLYWVWGTVGMELMYYGGCKYLPDIALFPALWGESFIWWGLSVWCLDPKDSVC